MADPERNDSAKAHRREDEVLRREYATADAVTDRERQRRLAATAEQLERERVAVDRTLLLERAGVDEILAHRHEFVGMVSHDLRNELSAIALKVAGIIRDTPNDAGNGRTVRSATEIQRATVRMGRLLNDLLDMVSIDVGKFTVVPVEQNVRRVVYEVVDSLAPMASAKKICLTCEIADDRMVADLDYYRMLQVLGNLLTNALSHTPEGGRITVRAQRASGQLTVSVADTGPGIAPERLETGFDRFVQGARPHRKGVGLGLYLAKSIVEAHGGRIWAESALGAGTTFHFTIPDRKARGSRRRPLPTRSEGDPRSGPLPAP